MKLLGTVQEIHDNYCVIFDTISYFDELEKFDRNMQVALEM